jgi:hypothetical protein
MKTMCPHCNTEYDIEAQYKGQTFACPNCQKNFQIVDLTDKETVSPVPSSNLIVQPLPGYNSWPFIQVLGGNLVCIYSRGTQHYYGEISRGVYARTSEDGGASWSEETMVANSSEGAESAIGKGLDSTAALLVWIRHAGPEWHHDLYRTVDGTHFQRIAQLKLDPMPMQITDIFTVPGVGLMSLWFAGNYKENLEHSWGTLISEDNGITWKQNIVESGLSKQEWPTEPSAVYLGNGRILAVARVEGKSDKSSHAQFQLESYDYGKTWKRARTNITDVLESTPSLVLDRGRIFNYYFQRMTGELKCRTAAPDFILGKPLCWSAPETVAYGSKAWHHAGNVNATLYGNLHYLAFYSGDENGTEILLKIIHRQ